jgi:hypothetical protein
MRISRLWKRTWLLPALALALALVAAGCSRSQTDAQLAGEVQNKINGDLPARQIVASAAQGTVTLSGTVNTEAERLRASSDAAQVEGVKVVINDLQVTPAAASIPEAPAPSLPQPEPAVRRASRHRATLRPVTEASQGPPASQAASPASPVAPPPAPVRALAPPPAPVTIPSGTLLAVRIADGIDSEHNQIGDTFRGSLEAPIVADGEVVVPAGTDVEGRVTALKSAGHFSGRSELALELTRLDVNGRTYPLETDAWTQQGDSRGKRTAATVGGGAVLGAIIGAIAGGGKGAAIGTVAGAGAGTGVQAATRGKQLKVRPEAVLDFRLQNSIRVVPTALHQAERRRLEP